MSDSENENEQTLAEDIVLTKYKMGSDIVTSTLSYILKKCVEGAKVIDLCIAGDNRIMDETAKVFKKEKDMKKGIAFPTCICVNHIICYYSPLKSDPNIIVLKNGDVVKVNLGAHIDGFPVVGGHTIVVGASKDNKVTGRKAEAILAAHYAAEACLRLMKAENENLKVSETVSKIAAEFNCKAVEGIQSHSMKRYEFHNNKSIVWGPYEDTKKISEKFIFEKYEVWNVNVVVSTGEGRPKEFDTRTTVHRKNDIVYQLKMKSSRLFFHEVTSKFASFPFSIRAFDDERIAKVGVMECRKHDLLEGMQVYHDRENEFVAMFQFTVLIMPNGPMRIGSLPFEIELYHSDLKIVKQELKDLLNNTSLGANKKKKKKKPSSVAIEKSETTAAAITVQ